MTRQQGMAAIAALFALCGVALSPIVAAQAQPGTADDERVAIAISSGSQLMLTQAGEAARLAAGMRQLMCDQVFRLRIADVGVHCVRPASDAAARLVQLTD